MADVINFKGPGGLEERIAKSSGIDKDVVSQRVNDTKNRLSTSTILSYGIKGLGALGKYTGLGAASIGMLPAAAAAYTVGLLADGAAYGVEAIADTIRDRSVGKVGGRAMNVVSNTVLPAGVSHLVNAGRSGLAGAIGNALSNNAEYSAMKKAAVANVSNLQRAPKGRSRIVGPQQQLKRAA